MTSIRRRIVRVAAVVLTCPVMAVGCADSRGGEAAATTTGGGLRQTVITPRVPAAVDTISGRLTAAALHAIQPRAGTTASMVLLFVREQDVFTCEDLGRQSRELRHWTSMRNLPFMVWAETGENTRVSVFLRRERISTDVVFLTPLPLELEGGAVLRSPAALVVNTATGDVRGFAHPERVPNVRQRSFAQELRDIDHS